uniref:Active breakpoint cluster region-related protein n=1 Tax=Aceria tosichella TaxID=561515 RepID=A0A6G1SK11_9ACAR
MPVPKTMPDLDSWAEFIPQERSNDAEFNLLIRKFKSFFNEVKEYQRLHSDCPVARTNAASDVGTSLTRSSINQPNTSSSQPTAASISIQKDAPMMNSVDDKSPEQFKSSTLSSMNNYQQSQKINGQHVINLRKNFIQNQDSGLPKSNDHQHQQQQQLVFNQSNVTRPTHRILLQNTSARSIDSTKQHYSSSNNLISLNLNSSLNNSQTETFKNSVKQPEIKQRSQISTSSRLLMSKSSERLDSINNNYRGASSLENSLEVNLSQNRPQFRRGLHLQDDDNIYDAVSQDVDPVQPVSDRICPGNINNKDPSGFANNERQLTVNSTQEINEIAPPLPVPMISNTPNSNTNDQERSSSSYNSSSLINGSTNTFSSQSLVPNYRDQEYGNYVNIDFFLKRNRSPSFDDLDERESGDDTSDEDTTQMSHTYSNSQLCDESLKDLSPRELARKLSTNLDQTNSSSSLTPASSGDFLDDSRSPTALQMSTTSSFSKHFEINNKHGSFFSSTVNRESDSSIQARSSTTPRESIGSRVSLIHNQKGLSLIQEDRTAVSPKQSLSRESSQLYSDSYALNEAQTSMRSFLSDLNLSPVDDVFEDKSQRRIVKESFAVESCGRRKLRHLFLFNDVIVCAKYQASSKQKFTFDVKWYLNLHNVTVSDVYEANNQVKFDKEAIENQILSIRTSLMLLRGRMQQIKRSKDKRPSKIIKKLKKKRTELEAELVLLLPHLPLVIKHANGKKFLFFLSSNFDRNQWIESIKYLQSQLPPQTSSSSSPSSSELQAWIQTCRKNLNPSLGTFLLRSNCDDDLLHGDLFINLTSISGLPKPGHYYFCFEVDSYGHFSQKASSTVLRISETDQDLNEEYVLPLDGAHTLRILLHEDVGQNSKPLVIGKAHVELSRAWFFDKPVDRIIEFNINCRSLARLSYSNLELLSIRIPHAKLCPTFGLDITQVCKKEKTTVPMLIQLCVNEVERRGMREVGIYRMSGTSTDIQRLKKAFETNPYVAELLLRDIDINSVTGFLKTYLREMPEGLFINKLYLKFVAAFNIPQNDSLERTKKMLELFHKIPLTNQHTIIYLVEHLVKVNKYESHNKMSLTNLATVLGPNILRPPANCNSNDSSDPFTAVVIGSMSQAGILYFFLNRKASNLPLTELDLSELETRTTSEA